MDWPLAISRNQDALRRIVAALFALAGMSVGRTFSSVPRHIFHAIFFVLRPAESAVRRLILIAARGLALKPRARQAAPVGLIQRPGAPRTLAFQLMDPLKSCDADAIWNGQEPPMFTYVQPYNPADSCCEAPSPLELVEATLLGLRLNALQRALDDLPRQARRLARWQALRDLALKANRPTRMSPVRPGAPPGRRRRSLHDVDDVLRECHALALDLLNEPGSG